MQAKFDYYNQLQNPVLYVCNPDNRFLAPIASYTDCNLTVIFNDISELSFSVPKYLAGSDGKKEQDCYRWLQRRRQIHVEGVGFFQIDDITERDDGIEILKQIDCTSCETELQNKELFLPEGVRRFYDPQSPDGTVLGEILALFPSWSAGELDSQVAGLYREFTSDVSESALSFLIGEVQERFECIVSFDIENRLIHVQDANKGIPATDIFLSHDDVVESIEIKSSSEDLVTALKVSGDDITFRDVNPTSSDVIYRFTPFMTTDWMSQGLIDRIQEWEADIAQAEGDFQEICKSLQQAQARLLELETEYATLKSELSASQSELPSVPTESRDEILLEINEIRAKMEEKEREIKQQEQTVEQERAKLRELQEPLVLQNYFNAEQSKELDRFIFQSQFKDDTIAVTKNMTYEEKMEQALKLYNRSKDLLKQLCEPQTTFCIDCSNFLFLKQFQPYHEQLELGSLIHVELSPGDTASLLLQKMEIDFDDKNFSMTFGNRYRINDVYSKYENIFGNISKSASEVYYNRDLWNYPVQTGLIDEMERYISGTLNATKNNIISSEKEEIRMDSTGILCRTPKADGEGFEPEQVWITHGGIVYTNDNFKTIKTALGKIITPEGKEEYGLIAESLIGKMLLGNQIKISNSSGTFLIDEDGINGRQIDEEGGQMTRLQADAEGFQFDIYNGSCSNLLTNSSGLSGLNNWEISGGVSVQAEPDSVSKSAFRIPAGGSMKQVVGCNKGASYCLSFKIQQKGASASQANGATVSLDSNPVFQSDYIDDQSFSSGEIFTFESEPYQTQGISMEVSLVNGSSTELLVSDLMLVEGLAPKDWSPSIRETQNTNVKIDRDGITVSSSESAAKTRINTASFRITGQNNQELIRIANEETVLNQTAIHGALTVGDLQIIPKEGLGVDFILLGE